ncbi:MAG: ABC transporter ATP-binding protein [Bdellovibrionaceae bacterium]|nr:ABC transporter ATP-binding protein [Pseudobdellovibrionaceae bacterium]MBX3035018.1 ABC transporter ATP-binding protein [Pseudobdellovibrionaceae bacterium]
MNLVEVSGLDKTFKGGLFEKSRQVLFDVRFALPAGETCGFVGGNGQGKTTTIKCLFGFIRPDRGEIRFFGRPLGPREKKRIGYMPERPYLYEFLTGREFLRLHWSLVGASGDFPAACESILRRVDLSHAVDKRLRSYSKGMLQRIGLAQALIHSPDLLILDEPMSGLDPDGRLLVKEILREEKARGATIFFSSHLLQDMDELCTHLTVIEAGRILHDGAVASFRNEHPDLEKAFRAWRLKHRGGLP